MQSVRQKILIVITKSNWGGAQRYVYDLATHLPSEKFDVTVALGGNGPLVGQLRDAHIRVIEIPGLTRDVHIGKDIGVFRFLLQTFRRERPDVVHLNSSKIGALGALAARLAQVPRIVFTAHGWAFNESRGFLSRRFIALIYVITIGLCHATIAVSKGMRQQVLHWPLVARRIQVIQNGLESPQFIDREVARTALRSHPVIDTALRTNPHTQLIGTVAELHPIKGHMDALLALPQVPSEYPYCYVLIGDGELHDSLQETIVKLGLESRVALYGYLSEAARYMPAFDILLHPSHSEALAYVVLEAGHAALPVIATGVGGIPEIISNPSEGVIVEPQKPEQLAEALTEVLANTTAAHELGQHLQKKVREHFTITEMVSQTVAVYAQGR